MRLKNKYPWLIIPFFVLLLYWRLPQTFWQQDEWHHLGVEYIWHSKGFLGFVTKDAFSPVGVRFLPFSSLVNFFQFSAFGQNPTGYAIVSLALHAVNALLVFVLVKRLTKDRLTAFLAGSFFATTSVHSQAVTWLIQHTTTLPALSFFLLSIILLLNRKVFWSLTSALVALFFKETVAFIFPPLLFAGMSLFVPSAKALSAIPKAIAQSFFPDEFWRRLSLTLATKTPLANSLPGQNTAQLDFIVERVISQVLLVTFAVVVVLVVFHLSSRKRDKSYLLALSLIFFTSLPLVFIPSLSEGFGFLEPRYLYIPAVGASLVLALVSAKLIRKNHLFWILPLVLILANGFYANRKLSQQESLGKTRRSILNQISTKYDTLPEKVVFYTKSDKAYYGLPPEENVMPFQSGFGQTLLIWYHPQERFPVEFMENNFLWGITDEGYLEINGRGFGYFRNFDLLKDAVDKHNIPSDSIIAFSWESEINMLIDITEETRSDLD